VHVGAAALPRLRHANLEVVQAERVEELIADDVAVVAAGHRLDHHGGGPVRRLAVVVHPRAGGPLEGEVADLSAQ
jgi:hypothetical protein